jgi:F0F1-type ATP synthase membrane subunit b/b'
MNFIYRYFTTAVLLGAIIISKELFVINEELLVALCFFLLVFLIYRTSKEPISLFLESRAVTLAKELESFYRTQKSLEELKISTLLTYSEATKSIEKTKQYCEFILTSSITNSYNGIKAYLQSEIEEILTDLQKSEQLERNKVLNIIYIHLKRELFKKKKKPIVKTNSRKSKKAKILANNNRNKLLAKIKGLCN